MSATARLAQEADIPALGRLDRWPREQIWRQKIAAGEVIVLEDDERAIGLVRYAVLWTTVPFMGLIEIEAAHRRRRGRTRLPANALAVALQHPEC